MLTKYVLLSLSILAVLSCQNQEKTENVSVNGIWKSVGYGQLLKIDAATYQYFDLTSISCLPSKTGDISELKNAMVLKNDTLGVKRGFNRYYYTRTSEALDLCKKNRKETKDPVYNFEVYAETYKDHYAFFELNRIDWDSYYKTVKAKINPNTTEVELYSIFQTMIDSLKDNHGGIEPTDEVYELAENQNVEEEETEQLKEYGDFQIADLVAEHYLKEDLTKDSWLIHWGKMKNNRGYIQIKAMFLYADLNLNDSLVKENGFVPTYMDAFNNLGYEEQIAAEIAGVRNIMNTIMQDLKETEYMIIDVRFNGGGQDEVSLEILRHFNTNKKLIAFKKARHKNGYSKKTPIYLESVKNPYTKPVYLLTSQQSASATDMMALASMGITQLKRIGSPTYGAISDALHKTLPNGWHFSLSNEVYTDINENCYENIGIPVDYELNYPEDRQTFFRSVANDLEKDNQDILKSIEELQSN